jgi:hypothetical protein
MGGNPVGSELVRGTAGNDHDGGTAGMGTYGSGADDAAGRASPSKYSKIKFTEALSLRAIRVSTFDYVCQDGELYYVETADHFAMKICGQMFHGNIGTIYTDDKDPKKIKDCKFASGCAKHNNCNYYHDPVRFPGSRDHRNYIANSFLYSPPNGQYGSSRFRSRRFGSREYLDVDIVRLGSEEIDRFYSQTMHDLLCAMLLAQSHAPRSA